MRPTGARLGEPHGSRIVKRLAIRLVLGVFVCGLVAAIIIGGRSAIRASRIQLDVHARAMIESQLAREFARVVANSSPMPPPVAAEGIGRARASMPVMPLEIPLPQNPGLRLVQPKGGLESTLRSSPSVSPTADKRFPESSPKPPAGEGD